MDHKSFVAIFKKDVMTLSQRLQCIMLRIQQYRSMIIYTPGPDHFMANWLVWDNQREGKDSEIPSMKFSIDIMHILTDIPPCMLIKDMQQATHQDDHLQNVKDYIIQVRPANKNEIPQELRPYL